MEREKSPSDVIESAIWDVLTEGVFTVIPGIAESWYPDRRQVDARPALERKTDDGQVEPRSLCRNVPVHFPTGGGFTSTHPIEEGDEITLLFSMRSIDRWIERGGVVDPKDGRKFDPSDAFAIPAALSKPESDTVQDHMYHGTRDGSCAFRVYSDDTVAIGTSNADLVTLAKRSANQAKAIADTLTTATVATQNGPQPLDPATISDLNAAITALEDIVSKLESIES